MHEGPGARSAHGGPDHQPLLPHSARALPKSASVSSRGSGEPDTRRSESVPLAARTLAHVASTGDVVNCSTGPATRSTQGLAPSAATWRASACGARRSSGFQLVRKDCCEATWTNMNDQLGAGVGACV